MAELGKNLPSPPTPEQLQTVTEYRMTSQDLINAAKRMSLEEKKSFLMSLVEADDKAIGYALKNQVFPEKEKELTSDQGWTGGLKHVWDNFGEALEPVEKIVTILAFCLSMGWVKPVPNQVIVDSQKPGKMELVYKEPALERSQRERGFGKSNLLRKQVEDLLHREASGEISEEEFHNIYGELLQVHSPAFVTLKATPQETSKNIQLYEVDVFKPSILK